MYNIDVMGHGVEGKNDPCVEWHIPLAGQHETSTSLSLFMPLPLVSMAGNNWIKKRFIQHLDFSYGP